MTLSKALGVSESIDGARYVKHRPRVLALLWWKPAWGLGGGILTLLAVFGERIFPVGNSAATGIGVLFAARGIGTAVGPIVARRLVGEGQASMQSTIGIAFLIGGAFYIAFASTSSFVIALIVLGLAHTGGSILWVFSTVLLQRGVEDSFRGRVFAAELALLTLTMAASNYFTGEMLDRLGFSARRVTIVSGIIFLIPGVVWFATKRWWDRGRPGASETPETPPWRKQEVPGRCGERIKKIKIGVMGSAAEPRADADYLRSKSEALGRAIARRGMICLTGATTGVVYIVGKSAREGGAFHVGVSSQPTTRRNMSNTISCRPMPVTS